MHNGKSAAEQAAEMVICKGQTGGASDQQLCEAAYNEELTVRPYETKVYYYIIRSNG